MRPRSSVRTTVLLLAALPVAIAAIGIRSAVHTAEASPTRGREIARIRAHFDSVLVELTTRDLGALAPQQRARRAMRLATLRAYRDRGVFPHNYDFPGRAVPYFVDRKTGTLCAVAHLLATSGRRDIVDRVARADNNVRVPALAHDTAFTGWLDASGLTLAEAARIQVPYNETSSVAQTVVVPLGSLVSIGGATVTSLVNASTNGDGHGGVRSALGVAFGASGVGFGVAALASDNISPAWGVATIASGAVSALVAGHGIVRHQRVLAKQRRRLRPIVTPVVPVDGKSSAGLAVAMRF